MALQEEFSKTSQIEGPRIYIINHADKMSTQAANSLLKFIEEPTSEETYGILITEQKDSILPTIISRSIILNFDMPKKTIKTLCQMANFLHIDMLEPVVFADASKKRFI